MFNSSGRETKRFALLGGIIIIIASLSLSVFHRQIGSAELHAMGERNNVALTRIFSNAIWPRYAEFLGTAHELTVRDLRSHPRTRELRRNVLSLMNGLSVVKVKIYDLDGLTVFSTDHTQIGEDKSGNAGFLGARAGHISSELTHRDTFSAFEQVIEDRDVLSSYIPISSALGEIEGVFEVYYDVTGMLNRIEGSQLLQVVVVGVTFVVLYVLLMTVVWRSERLSQRQHQENLELARNAASADESSRLKSEFLANISHELRTPLNAIIGFSEAITHETFGPVGNRKYKDYVASIHVSGMHLLSIINDLLDLSKIDAGKVELQEEEIDLGRVANSAIQIVSERASAAGSELKLSMTGSLPKLRADERAIKQILLNLLSNAIKFTPSKGQIIVQAEVDGEGRVVLMVSDSGIGIAEEDVPLVLAPFSQLEDSQTRKHHGTGLGLTIVQKLVDLHGGSFNLESEVGVGTRVFVRFPTERTIYS